MTSLLQWTKAGVTTALHIDVAEREGYESTAEATDKAVERGAAITDHVRPQADTFTVEGLVSNTPIVVPAHGLDGATGTTRPAETDGKDSKPSTLQWSTTFDRARFYDNLLRGLVREGQLLTYTGSLRQATDCVLLRYRVDRDVTTGNDLPITLELKQLRLVNTQRVNVPEPTQRRGQRARNRGAQAATQTPEQQRAARRSAAIGLARQAGIRLPGGST